MATTCKAGCGIPVFFALTHKGFTAIFDQDPHPKGNRIKTFVDGTLVMVPVQPDTPATEPRYIDHHGTCPEARKFRRRAR